MHVEVFLQVPGIYVTGKTSFVDLFDQFGNLMTFIRHDMDCEV